MQIALALLIVLLIATNGITLFFLLKPKVVRKESIELQEFMRDLLNGEGLIRIIRVSPDDFLLRSPKGRR